MKTGSNHQTGKRDEITVKTTQRAVIFNTENYQQRRRSKIIVKCNAGLPSVLKKSCAEKKYEAETIKSYLMSNFYTFLISDRPKNFDFDVEQANANTEKVKLWSGSFKKESSERKWQKLDEDMINRLTPANIQSLEMSKKLGALMRCHNKKHPNADGNTTGESSKKDDEDRDSDGTAKELQIKRFYALMVI